MEVSAIRQCVRRTLRSFLHLLPIMLGMLLLTSLVITLLPKASLAGFFGASEVTDVLLGAGLGSVVAVHPLLSYVLGGELLAAGVSLVAVTALIVSWVTVAVVQLPAEALLLGKRFAFYRNGSCFLLAILVALLTVYSLDLLGGA